MVQCKAITMGTTAFRLPNIPFKPKIQYHNALQTHYESEDFDYVDKKGNLEKSIAAVTKESRLLSQIEAVKGRIKIQFIKQYGTMPNESELVLFYKEYLRVKDEESKVSAIAYFQKYLEWQAIDMRKLIHSGMSANEASVFIKTDKRMVRKLKNWYNLRKTN